MQSLQIRKSNFIVKNEDPIEKHYKITDKALGSGAFGVVSSAEHIATKQIRAIKTIPKTKIKDPARFEQEVAILKQLDHPNVIKLYEHFEDEKNVHLVCELCTGGELFDHIVAEEFFSEDYAAFIFKKVRQAILYCHNNDIAHRDLKPENFIYVNRPSEDDMCSDEIKVIDFGLSKVCHKRTSGKAERLNTAAGTAFYIAPEVLAGNYDKSCDIWSAGCILYIFLCGYPPFNGKDDEEILRNVQKGHFTFNGDWTNISKEAKNLIKKMICKPERRLTAQEVLKHEWFRQYEPENKKKSSIKKRNMKAFKQFVKTQKLQQAALTAIALQASPEDVKKLADTFRALDKNGDGTLTFEELKTGLGHVEDAESLLAILKGADTDNSGSIDYTEFLAATIDKKTFMREDYLRNAFNMFDKDGSGKITVDELRQLLQGEDMPKAEVIEGYIREVDMDGDGELDFAEFREMMVKCKA